MENLNLSIFERSPIPMWIQDYSGTKKIFERWTQQGVSDIRSYLIEDPNRLRECLATIRTIRINQSTLKLYEAKNLKEILDNFANLHFRNITIPQVNFFVGLWEKNHECMFAPINYTCLGKQIDVQLRANILEGYEDTWEQILLTTEDISEYQNARRFAESLFMYSPTALWVRDYSQLKILFDDLREQGVEDLNQYMDCNPDFFYKCAKSIIDININQALLNLFKANDQQQFKASLKHIFRENHFPTFRTQLIHLWAGHHHLKRECEYQTLEGDLLHIQEQLVIFPDSHHNWDTVQIAFTDFTERKLLEEHLNYVSRHDQLTQLSNRTFFNEEIIRIQTEGIAPISCIYIDINGLKIINDSHGHDYGDQLLRRFAQILKKVTFNTTYSISRIGGDEFVILMPHAGESEAAELLDEIQELITDDNLHHPLLKISVSAGIASTDKHTEVENLIRLTDHIMYEQKKLFYQQVT